jgi:(E)-4-hydroxy-3-methyl-but-2-enyl pyrophosphate reductase
MGELAMEVTRAREMGFCFGVQRAMNLITGEATSGTQGTYLLGKLVHNRQAVARLESVGAILVSSLDEVPRGGTVVVSTHGMGPEVRREVESRGLHLVDATCPFVRHIHNVVTAMARDGFTIFVYGDAGHKEVQGILAWSGGKGTAIQSAGDVTTRAKKIGLVSQTTKNIDSYRGIVRDVVGEYIGKIAELRVADTICDATAQRQEAAVDLARQVEAIVVVGGADSANTKRLGELCGDTGTPAFVIEEASEVNPAWFRGLTRVGVTAGASTPEWVIDQVVERLREIGGDGK